MVRDESFAATTCDGSRDCGADTHIHGCFADEGNCDEPLEHGTGDLDADLDALGFDPFGDGRGR